MKALIADRYGKKDGVRMIGEMPGPEVRENDVLVQVNAAAVNILDSKIRNGEFRLILPYRRPASVRVFFLSRKDTALEILALRQQIVVLKRKRPRPRLNPLDRLFWIILYCFWSRWAEVLVAV